MPLGELGHGHAACSDGPEHSQIAALDSLNFASGVVEVRQGVFRRDVDDYLHLGDIREGDSALLLRLLVSLSSSGGGRGVWRSVVPAA